VQSISTIRNQLSANSTALIAKVNAIATAITQDLLGGVVGTSANRLLRTKTVSSPSSAGSVQNTPITCDDSGNLTGLASITGSGDITFTSGTLNIATLNPTNALTVPHGGTGDASFTAYAVICGGTTSTGALQSIAGVGTSGQVLTSNDAAALPTFQTPAKPASASTTYTTNAALGTTTPYDDTIPQITEGNQILSLSIACVRSTSKVKVSFAGTGGVATAGPLTVALYVDSGADAVQVTLCQTAATNTEYPTSMEYYYTPGDTASHTLSVRVGATTGNAFMNGAGTATRRYGGAAACTLIAQEIFQ
jgi:hypothetical protein